MKNQKLLLVLLFGMFVTFQSCEKKDFVTEENSLVKENIVTADKINVSYYFNEVLITDNPLNIKESKSSEIKNIMVVLEKPQKGFDEKMSIHSFDSDEQYIKWGEKNNIPVADILDRERKLQEFVKKNNIEDIYEKTGTFPDNYKEFVKKLFKFEQNNKSATAVFIFKDFSGGDAWSFLNTIPTLKHTLWDNQISRYYDTAVYGAVTFYDGYWYRKKMATLWNWGWQTVKFQGALSNLNDKTSSVINW